MSSTSRSSVIAGLLIGIACIGFAENNANAAEDFPARPVKVVSQAAPGSALDVFGRLVTRELASLWPAGIVLENRPGGGGVVAAQAVLSGARDGYTLLHAAASLFTIAPAEHGKLAIDVNRDLVPVAHLGELPLLVVAAKSTGIDSLPQLLDRARREPGRMNIGTNGAGTFPYLAASLLIERSGAPITVVPYARGGASEVLRDILGGRLHATMEAISGLRGAIDSGQVRALAITASERLPAYPELPTVAEAVPGFAAVGWSVLAAPSGTPPSVVERIDESVRRALANPTLKNRLAELGVYPRAMHSKELAAFIVAEQRTWWPVVKALALGEVAK